MRNKSKLPGYAVVRIDYYGPSIEEHHITVKEVVPTLEEAQAEVERLNRINGEKGCKYFWQYTRLIGF